jgi:ABC-type multidrug transport system ATPase subunit
MNKITIDSVYLTFDERIILDNISIAVNQHEVVGLLGRNGCGKSCLLKILLGFMTPQYSVVKFNDTYLKKPFSKKNFINYLPQTNCHPKEMSILNLLKWYEIEADEFYKNYDFLKEHASKKFGELSGGEKRLFEVLIVLEANTQFTILDEPFSHIMPLHLDLLKDVIQKIKQKKGIIITDHLYENVLDISDKVYLISDRCSYIVHTKEDLIERGYIR